MSLLGRLLRGKEPAFEELTAGRDDCQKRREEKRLALKKLLVQRDQILTGLKTARRAGDDFKVDTLWDELQDTGRDVAMTRREAKVAGLEYQTLRRYVSGMEHMNRQGDREGVRKLFERARSSRLPELLGRAELDEERYLQELDLLVSEDAESEALPEDDPRKEAFLRRLDTIAETESEGQVEEARRQENQLKQELEDGEI